MKDSDAEVFALQAEFCKVLAHPKRLMMIHLLSEGERSVGELAAATRLSPTNTSQHLRVLKDRRVVKTRKDGQAVYYSLRHPELLQACQVIRGVLLDNLKASGQVAMDATIPLGKR